MKTITELCNELKLDKGTIIPNDGQMHGPRLHFSKIYDQYFYNKNDVLKIVEIGVENGNSLKMWETYFPNAKIYGIDINDKSQYNTERIKTFKANQGNRNELKGVFESIGSDIDIIIDDGSHVIKHQLITMGISFRYLKKHGMLFIEDLHTSDHSVWNNKKLYGNDMSFNIGESTVDVLKNYIENGKIETKDIIKDDIDYLNNNISEIKIFELPKTFYGENLLALIRKKI